MISELLKETLRLGEMNLLNLSRGLWTPNFLVSS